MIQMTNPIDPAVVDALGVDGCAPRVLAGVGAPGPLVIAPLG